MRVTTYLTFNGACEAAFKFYEQCLGGQLGPIFRYGGSAMADTAPADWQDKVMHGSITIGELVVAGADIVPGSYEEPKGFSLSLNLKSAHDADRIFHDLAAGGRVLAPLEKTFWAERFGMVVDRFGIPWMVNCEGTDRAGPADAA